jgi:hypothetical protein
MNALKKLIGLLVFVAALAGAFALSRYFSGPRPAPVKDEGRDPQVIRPELPPPPAGPAPPVRFKPQLVVLDLSDGKSYVTLELEQGAAESAPERLWVWADFFSVEGALRTRCAGVPVEVRRPFMRGRRTTVVVEIPARGCDATRAPSATYYARVNVSAESAEAAARPPGDPDDYDITKATPVVVQRARLWKEPGAGRLHTPDASRRHVPRSEREE